MSHPSCPQRRPSSLACRAALGASALTLALTAGCWERDTPESTNLGSIPSQLTLSAAEAKRYNFDGVAGDTVVVDATMPNANTDIDISLYGPNGNRLATSQRNAGLPDNIRVRLQHTGEHALDVVNISRGRVATCTLRSQVLRGSSASNVNGVYRLEIPRMSVDPSLAQEKWLFADGRLLSRYVFMSGDIFGVDEDMVAWIDHRPGGATDIWWHNSHVRIETASSTTTISRSTVRVHFTVDEEGADAYGNTLTASIANEFSGDISEGGAVITGTVTVNASGDLEGLDYALPIRLVRE